MSLTVSLGLTVPNFGHLTSKLFLILRVNLSNDTDVMHFYRAKLRVARYCQGTLSVCPSVCDVEVS